MEQFFMFTKFTITLPQIFKNLVQMSFKEKKLSTKMTTEIVPTEKNETSKKKRDPTNYIKAAKKNQWIKHVKNIGKKSNISYKEALKLCKKIKK